MFMSRCIRYTFILLIVGIGLIYVFLIPPFEAPDEPAHFARAYGFAEGQFILRDLPRPVVQYMVDELQKRHPGHNVFVPIRELLKQYPDRIPIPGLVVYATQYSPIAYGFHAAALKMMMLCAGKTDVRLSLYLCRMVSLLLFSGMMFAVFKLSGNMALPLFWIAVTPMALSQASVVNPDGIVFAASTMILAVSLQNPSLLTYTAWMIVSAIMLISTKPPYAPVFLVSFAALYRNGRMDMPKLAGLTAALVLSFGSMAYWSWIVKTHGIYEKMMDVIQEYNSPAINPHLQWMGLLHAPWEIWNIVVHTISLQGGLLLHQFVGILGWVSVPVPEWTAGLWCVMCLAAVLLAKRPEGVSPRLALVWGGVSLSAAILTFLGVTLSIYLIWMPVQAPFVSLQGRYFHPVAAILCVALILMKPVEFDLERMRGAVGIFGLSALIIHMTTWYVVWENYYCAAFL